LIEFATAHDESAIGVRPFSDEMAKLPAIFPNLKKISLGTCSCDSNGLEQFVKAMDGRLTGPCLTACRRI
jgi:hypothetical protein